MTSFTVIQDTREKAPLRFQSKAIRDVSVQVLKTGDYTIEGLEETLCIERKMGVAELAKNATEKRFKDVVERMKTYRFRYILIECSLDEVMNFPVGSSIPRARWKTLKIKGPYIMKFLSELYVNHGIPVIFCDNAKHCAYMASNIMKRVKEIIDAEDSEAQDPSA